MIEDFGCLNYMRKAKSMQMIIVIICIDLSCCLHYFTFVTFLGLGCSVNCDEAWSSYHLDGMFGVEEC